VGLSLHKLNSKTYIEQETLTYVLGKKLGVILKINVDITDKDSIYTQHTHTHTHTHTHIYIYMNVCIIYYLAV
jgi:hypothetical protein